jgi:hypothetical protein
MAWWIPALKAVLPHVGTIIDAAKPVFTRKSPSAPVAPGEQAELAQQQIAELQAAVSQNAANVRELAAQLQSTVAAIEQAATVAERNLRRSQVFAITALVFSTVALCAAVVVVLVLLSATARAQEAPRPALKAGDEWKFAVYYTAPTAVPSREWRITSVGEVIAATENGAPLRLTPELNVLESPDRRESNPQQLKFPLAVGKQWRYDSEWLFKPKGSKGTIAMEVAVVAHEAVRVPAGTFDAFKLVAKGRLGGTSPIGSQYDHESTTTYWYAPAARAIVRSVHHNPYLGTSTVELVQLRLQ